MNKYDKFILWTFGMITIQIIPTKFQSYEDISNGGVIIMIILGLIYLSYPIYLLFNKNGKEKK